MKNLQLSFSTSPTVNCTNLCCTYS